MDDRARPADAERPDPTPPARARRRAAAATVGVGGALAACGETSRSVRSPTDTDATNLPAPPPTQQPINCSVMSFFTLEEAERSTRSSRG